MIAICKREFRSLFQNVTGWIFVGVTMFFYGLYFTIIQLMQGYGNIAHTLSAITFITLVTSPIVTMRIFSEERRNKTDQLIMTAPVSTFKIVMGKFLALAATFGICIVFMALSPLLLSFFGEVPFVTGYIALLGFFVYGLAALAIGMFVSSLTEKQLISAVASFVLLFLGYVMTNLTNLISASGNLLTKILNCYDLYTPVNDFMGGNLNLVNLVYFLSIIVLCLFLTYEGIQKRRWSVSARKISFSVFSTATFVLGLVIIVLLNVGIRAIPSTYTALDFTEQGLYSLTKTSKDYLKTLDQDVTLYHYGTKSSADETVVKLLTNYKTASKHITVKYVNPSEYPNFAANFGEDSIANDSIIVQCGDVHKVIGYTDLYELQVDYSTYSYVPTGFDGEGEITAAIHYVTSGERPTIYVMSGHNEAELEDSFKEAATKANIDLENLNFLSADGVPEDADAVLIHGAQMDFSDDDVAKLQAYLDAGGELIVTFDYGSVANMPKFRKVLENYGVTVSDGVVGDFDDNYVYQSFFYLLPVVSTDAVNGDLAGSLSVFMPTSVAFYTDESREDVTYTPLMTTSDEAGVITFDHLKELQTPEAENQTVSQKDFEDIGAKTVAMNVTGDSGCSIYLYGSSYMFKAATDEIVAGRNLRLFSQLITTVSDVDTENSIVVPAKMYDSATLTVTDYAIRMYAILWCFAIPIGAVIFGIVIWFMRRRK